MCEGASEVYCINKLPVYAKVYPGIHCACGFILQMRFRAHSRLSIAKVLFVNKLHDYSLGVVLFYVIQAVNQWIIYHVRVALLGYILLYMYTPPKKSGQDCAPSQVQNVTMRRFY